MRIDVVAIFPEIIGAFIRFGVLGRAIRQQLIQVHTHNVRDYADPPHCNTDDRPYGGGDGMVMSAEPIGRVLRAAKAAQLHSDRRKVIYLSAQGTPLTQAKINMLAQFKGLILLCGRYKGVDQRIIEAEVDEEYSLGDYVVSGGESAAMVLIDAVARQCPGVLGNKDSVENDAFMTGLLDFPHYTRPVDYQGSRVPDVLISGNHGEIARWRLQQTLGRTLERRPDLLKRRSLSEYERGLLSEYAAQHNLHWEDLPK